MSRQEIIKHFVWNFLGSLCFKHNWNYFSKNSNSSHLLSLPLTQSSPFYPITLSEFYPKMTYTSCFETNKISVKIVATWTFLYIIFQNVNSISNKTKSISIRKVQIFNKTKVFNFFCHNFCHFQNDLTRKTNSKSVRGWMKNLIVLALILAVLWKEMIWSKVSMAKQFSNAKHDENVIEILREIYI